MEQRLIWDIVAYAATFMFLPAFFKDSRVSYKWFSLSGSLIFVIFGLFIQAYPVSIANGILVTTYLIELKKKYLNTESFKKLTVQTDSVYLNSFLEYHRKEIFYFFPNFEFEPNKYVHCFFILRDMNIAGLVLTRKYNEKILYLELDFVIPGFRDFRAGEFLYEDVKNFFIEEGYTKIISPCFNRNHEKYLKKMGFELKVIDDKRQFVKSFQ